MALRDRFESAAVAAAAWAGRPAASLAAAGVVLAWALAGPACGFSAAWQMVINTGTTVVTFLMVFLIQAAQNRNDRATHLKLNEIIRALERADNAAIGAEELPAAELEARMRNYLALCERARCAPDARPGPPAVDS